MLDVRAIREDPNRFRKGLARRNLAEAVDRILELDERRRALTTRVEELRAEQNRMGKAIGGAQGDEKQRLIAEVATPIFCMRPSALRLIMMTPMDPVTVVG